MSAKEVSDIQRAQKEIDLETAKLEAERIQTLAEAEAAGRRAIFEADNALKQRLEAWVQINEAYAGALQNKQLVPTIVMGGGNDDGQVAATDLISLLVAQTAKDLRNENRIKQESSWISDVSSARKRAGRPWSNFSALFPSGSLVLKWVQASPLVIP